MKYEEWKSTVPGEITGDPLWNVTAYRRALFAAEIAWHDVSKLARDRRTWDLSSQLYRALCSISANLAEGYSRASHREKARFYEYALGSARESRDWYYKARHLLGTEVTSHRLTLLTEIIRLLIAMVVDQRSRKMAETPAPYRADVHDEQTDQDNE